MHECFTFALWVSSDQTWLNCDYKNAFIFACRVGGEGITSLACRRWATSATRSLGQSSTTHALCSVRPEGAGSGSATRRPIGKISAKCCSFSAVSAPIFASKYAFYSIFQNLPDYLAEIFEIWHHFVNFATFAKILLKFHRNCWFFKPIFC